MISCGFLEFPMFDLPSDHFPVASALEPRTTPVAEADGRRLLCQAARGFVDLRFEGALGPQG